MDRPTTATGAATVLAELAAERVVFTRPFDPATGARLPFDWAAAGLETPPRGRPLGPGLVASLPAVLVPVPDEPLSPGGSLVGESMERTPDPDLVATEWAGFPYPVGVPLDSGTRHRDRARLRRLVLAGPEADPTPDGSRALTVSVLAARHTASELDRWAGVLPSRQAGQAEREAATYRTYATTAEALISDSFGWLDGLELPPAAPAFPTVPATARGSAVLGPTN